MELDKYDLNFCLRRLPQKVMDVMKAKEWQGKIFVGGGFIRAVIANEKVNDVDLFTGSLEQTSLLAGILAGGKPEKVIKTDNAYTIREKQPLQIIHRWLFDKPEDVSNSFDFTICCAVIFYKDGNWGSFCDDRFYKDLSAKRLVYRCPIRNEDAGGSMLRVLKYYQMGYRIPLDSLGNVIARLVKAVKVDKIAGGLDNEIDTGRVLCGLLRVVDPNVDPAHDAHLPSMVEPVEE